MYTCRRCLLVGIITFLSSMVIMQHLIQQISHHPTNKSKLNRTDTAIKQDKRRKTQTKHFALDFTINSGHELVKDTPVINLMAFSFIQSHNRNISISEYIEGYNHLYKLLNELGAVFSLIASDAREKIDILLVLTKTNEVNHHYRTLESMMAYEGQIYRENGHEMFGSRTLLRLHRALKFVLLFLEKLSEIKKDESVADIAYRSYLDSLGNFHSWVLRHAAKIAVYSLSSKHELVKKLFQSTLDPELVSSYLKFICKAIKLIYDDVESLYTKYELHNLP